MELMLHSYTIHKCDLFYFDPISEIHKKYVYKFVFGRRAPPLCSGDIYRAKLFGPHVTSHVENNKETSKTYPTINFFLGTQLMQNYTHFPITCFRTCLISFVFNYLFSKQALLCGIVIVMHCLSTDSMVLDVLASI